MSRVEFDMVLPPGWVRIPIARADEDFATIIRDAVAQVPPEKAAPVRTFLEAQIRTAIEAAREQATVEFILPLAPVLGIPIPASITVTTLTPPGSETRGPQEILVAMAGRGDATAIEIDGLVGLRRVRSAGATAGSPISADAQAHRSISYVCHIPWRDEWIAFTASILSGDDPELAEPLLAVEVLLDALISTVRFRRVEPADRVEGAQ